jgi:hypothetical protein
MAFVTRHTCSFGDLLITQDDQLLPFCYLPLKLMNLSVRAVQGHQVCVIVHVCLRLLHCQAYW